MVSESEAALSAVDIVVAAAVASIAAAAVVVAAVVIAAVVAVVEAAVVAVVIAAVVTVVVVALIIVAAAARDFEDVTCKGYQARSQDPRQSTIIHNCADGLYSEPQPCNPAAKTLPDLPLQSVQVV